MKKILQKFAVCFSLVLMIGCCYAPAASAISVAFDYVDYIPGVAEWNVNITGIYVTGDTKVVQGYDFDVLFNSALYAPTDISIVFNDILGDPNDLTKVVSWGGMLPSTTDTLDFGAISYLTPAQLYTLQSAENIGGNLTVATLLFNGSADPALQFTNWYDGTGSLTNINDIKGPGENNIIYAGPDYPVPEPGTLLLLGSGIGALIPFRHRFRLRR